METILDHTNGYAISGPTDGFRVKGGFLQQKHKVVLFDINNNPVNATYEWRNVPKVDENASDYESK